MNADGYVVIGTKLDTKSFDKQITDIERQLNDIDTMLSEPQTYNLSSADIEKLNLEAERLTNKLVNLRKQKKKLDEEDNQKFIDWLKNAGDNIEKNIKKISKWALAIFGLRSAYNLVRQSMSVLTQYDDQLASQLEGVRLILASSLEPIVRRIVDFVYVLLSYVNYITKSMLNFDIFANASAKALKKGASSAQSIKKSLTGIDEVNIVGTDTSAGGVGGGGDLEIKPTISDEEIEKNVKKVKGYLKSLTDFWETEIWQVIQDVDGNWDLFIGGILTSFKGAYDVLKGVIEVIIGLFDLLKSAFNDDLEGMKKAWSKMGEGFLKIMNGILEMVAGSFLTFVGIIKGILQSIWDVFKDIGRRIVDIFFTIGTTVGNVLAGAFKGVVNGVLGAIESILNTPIKAINNLIGKINSIPGINLSPLGIFNLPRLAKGGIVNMPGRGVMVGGAITGERGAEGVIPLTDSQQMELLGEAIGKYITINANITNSMNGRIISRELQKIQNESDFAFNR